MSADVHSRARLLIDQSLVGEISQADERWLRDHLAECAECEGFQNLSHSVLRSLGDFSFGVTAGATDRIQRAIADRAIQLTHDCSLRVRAFRAGIAALVLTVFGSSAVWNTASWASRYLSVSGSSLHLGVLIFWLLPSLGASLMLLLMPIYHNDAKREGHV